jgi:hypothetical protein
VRIIDILATHVRPGALVVDLTTRSGDDLSPEHWVPPGAGVTYTKAPILAEGPASAPALILHDLLVGGAGEVVDLGQATGGVLHLVLFDRIEAPLESGLLDRALGGGWELTATHQVRHDVFRFGLAFAQPAPGEEARARLRIVNEYRYDKLVLRVRTEQLKRLETRLEHAEARTQDQVRQREETEAKTQALAAEVARLTGDDLSEARAIAGRLRERVLRLEGELRGAQGELAEARRPVGSRIDAATREVRGSAGRVLERPVRWLASLRRPAGGKRRR